MDTILRKKMYSNLTLFNPNAPEVHVPTITEKGNGELLAAWFGGSKEGASDVAIYTSRFSHEKEMWSEPNVLVDVPGKYPGSNKLAIKNSTLNLRLKGCLPVCH